jgi:hypothetical protein
MTATADVSALPADVLRCVLGQLDQPDLASCMLVSKPVRDVALDPSLWTSMTIAHPDPSALRFFMRSGRCESVTLTGSPDDMAWFLSTVAARGGGDRLRHVCLRMATVTRVPDTLMAVLAGLPALETCSVSVDACQHPSVLRVPAGLTRLRELDVSESPTADDVWAMRRQVAVEFGHAAHALTALRRVTLNVASSDLVQRLHDFPALTSVTHHVDHETYHPAADLAAATPQPRRRFEYLELPVGEESLPDGFAAVMHGVDVDHLVVHARDELYVSCVLPARRVSLVMDNRAFGSDAQIVIEFPEFIESVAKGLRELRIDETASSKPGWSVRFVGVPGLAAWLDVVGRIQLHVAPTAQLEITPYLL